MGVEQPPQQPGPLRLVVRGWSSWSLAVRAAALLLVLACAIGARFVVLPLWPEIGAAWVALPLAALVVVVVLARHAVRRKT
ncbi:MAG TPA: hypothetical protein VFS21_09080 [Roseiflexaceae bacterium]|nr:hypothetical protein [Roseiflexaceae bacterium]